MLQRLTGVLLLSLILLLLASPANAQSGASVSLSLPNAAEFPRVEAYLDIHDDQGSFVHGLQAEQVSVVEDGNPLEASQLRELRAGVQVVVAISPGPAFAIRNAKAVSRYDMLKDALRRWANGRRGSTIDDLSLLIANGPAVSHSSDPALWVAGLDAEQVDARSAKPTLDILSRAVGLASDPLPRPGMGRAVLLVTPPPEGQLDQSHLALENLTAQAKQRDVPIFIWMVSSSGAFATQSVKQLAALAEATGGQFFTFTGEEALPSPEQYLEPLRHIYYLEYRSKATASGIHQVNVLVQVGENQLQSNMQGFEIDLQPPKPAFVSPPLQVKRKLPRDEGQALQGSAAALSNSADAAVVPQEQTLVVVFDFPDGRQRSITRSALLVDGQIVDENLEPPFDQFTWSLDTYQEDGIHQLQAQVTDDLGLTGASIEIPVQVTVEHRFSNPLESYKQNLPVLAALAALMAGALLFLVMILAGKLRPATLRAASMRRRSDPVSQPVQIQSESAAHWPPGWANRFRYLAPAQRFQKTTPLKAYAYLSPIAEAGPLAGVPPIPIRSDETAIGSDSIQSNLVFDDPSVDALHARLTRQENGVFRLADQGSIAGTWVNYTPVSKEGVCLEAGDLVHFGRLGFRFTLRQPSQVHKPMIQETAERQL